jgi:single-stranded DNA-binding protein
MLSVLATGRLAANPEVRTGPSGRPYTRARLFCPSEGGDVPLSMIAFGAVGEELATVPAGVAISVSGRFKLARWTAKDGTERTGLSVTVDALLYARPPRRRTRPPIHDEDDDGDVDEFDEYGEPRSRRRRRPVTDEEAEL